MAPDTGIIIHLFLTGANLSGLDVQICDYKGVAPMKVDGSGMGFAKGAMRVDFADGFGGLGSDNLIGNSSTSQMNVSMRCFETRINGFSIGTSE